MVVVAVVGNVGWCVAGEDGMVVVAGVVKMVR